MTPDHDPSSRSRRISTTSGIPHGAVTITERESIELLLLRNRGAIDAPEMRLFDRAVVSDVFFEIVRLGYLRSLDSIPAMEIYRCSYARLVFSAAGRIRFYQLERLLAASPAGSPIADPIGRSPRL